MCVLVCFCVNVRVWVCESVRVEAPSYLLGKHAKIGYNTHDDTHAQTLHNVPKIVDWG